MSEQPPKRAPLLTEQDKASGTWKKIAAHYEARLATLRAKNDAASWGKVQTAHQRGRIAECKTILALATEAPPIENEDLNFKD